jgi:hypothetical protein
MTLAWFGCGRAGADLAVLQAAVDALGTEPVRPTAAGDPSGLAATQVDVAARSATPGGPGPTFEPDRGGRPGRPGARPGAGRLRPLARAEAGARDPAEEVHSEVGALDSLADGRRLRGAARPGGQ